MMVHNYDKANYYIDFADTPIDNIIFTTIKIKLKNRLKNDSI
jgi:hypothetical protein